MDLMEVANIYFIILNHKYLQEFLVKKILNL